MNEKSEISGGIKTEDVRDTRMQKSIMYLKKSIVYLCGAVTEQIDFDDELSGSVFNAIEILGKQYNRLVSMRSEKD